MRFVLLFTCALLAACVGRTSFPPLSEGSDTVAPVGKSRAAELKTGMTLADASQIVGLAVQSHDNPATVGHVCFAHPYASADGQRFVHTVYLGGNLVAATDGHAAMCGPGDF